MQAVDGGNDLYLMARAHRAPRLERGAERRPRLGDEWHVAELRQLGAADRKAGTWRSSALAQRYAEATLSSTSGFSPGRAPRRAVRVTARMPDSTMPGSELRTPSRISASPSIA